MNDRVEHQALSSGKPFEGSGKETGLVHAPIVSMSPSGGNDNGPLDQKFDIIDVHKRVFNSEIEDAKDGYYPFGSLEVGQGFFVKPAKWQTVDKLYENINRTLWNVHTSYGEIMKNEDGDNILLNVTIEARKKNDDGTFQLQNGKPLVGAHFQHMPMYIFSRKFIAKAVAKNDIIGDNDLKASADGVLVVRVM